MTESAQAAGGAPWFVFVPALVLLAFVVATAPVWPYSRGWGWSVAGMSAVAMAVAVLFSVAWLAS